MPDLPGFSRNANQDSEARRKASGGASAKRERCPPPNLTEVIFHFRFAFLLKFQLR